MVCEAIPVNQNKSYSTQSVREAMVEHAAAEEGGYELVEAVPYPTNGNIQPPSST